MCFGCLSVLKFTEKLQNTPPAKYGSGYLSDIGIGYNRKLGYKVCRKKQGKLINLYYFCFIFTLYASCFNILMLQINNILPDNFKTF